VTDTGSTSISSWSVTWANDSSTVTNLWNGTLTSSGTSRTVKNAAYNGSLAPNAGTTFGFTANGSPPTGALTCTAS
jgi:cellulase/cellobiase CelA1